MKKILILILIIVGAFFALEKFYPQYRWETYRNEEFGYEIKYPKDWQVNELAPPTITITRDESRVIVEMYGADGRDYYEGTMVTSSTGEWERLDYFLTSDQEIIFSKITFKEKKFGEDYPTVTLEVTSQDFDVMEQILSTFKFVD